MLWFWTIYGIVAMIMVMIVKIDCRKTNKESPFSSNPMALLVQVMLGPIALVYKLFITLINRKGR